jgi:hypothetical protein
MEDFCSHLFQQDMQNHQLTPKIIKFEINGNNKQSYNIKS